MNRLLLISILVVIFQTFSNADDIKEFQIDGYSVGDSALNYITKEFIKSETSIHSFYKDKKYFEITFDSKDDIYENISLTFKNNDDEFTIYQLAGTISYKNINQCLNQKKNIANELTKIFLNADKVDAGKRNYAADPSGKSKTYIEYFWLSEGGFVEVGCYDITEELANNNNWLKTSLSVGIVTKEFSDFLSITKTIPIPILKALYIS